MTKLPLIMKNLDNEQIIHVQESIKEFFKVSAQQDLLVSEVADEILASLKSLKFSSEQFCDAKCQLKFVFDRKEFEQAVLQETIPNFVLQCQRQIRTIEKRTRGTKIII